MESKLVAVPARLSADDAADPRVGGANRLFDDVVSLIRANGFEPVILTKVDVELEGISGVVLPGGGDIDPKLYGGERVDALYDVNPDQDDLDLGLARAALERDLPILGICRGAQVLNVAYGGTLFADLAPTDVSHYVLPAPGEELTFSWHPVALPADSALRNELGTDELAVASGHHQGIDQLGAGLRPTAVAADGLVEAFEDISSRRIGVQWHPEAADTPHDTQNAPFRIFARAVAGEISHV